MLCTGYMPESAGESAQAEILQELLQVTHANAGQQVKQSSEEFCNSPAHMHTQKLV